MRYAALGDDGEDEVNTHTLQQTPCSGYGVCVVVCVAVCVLQSVCCSVCVALNDDSEDEVCVCGRCSECVAACLW